VPQEDPAAILDIKEDIRDECSKLGEVTNVVLFDKEQEGVASVRFSTPEAAVACVKVYGISLYMYWKSQGLTRSSSL
jgi:HIV Tat-specific factor 1